MNNHKSPEQSVPVQAILPDLNVDLVGVAHLDDLRVPKLKETALRLLPETRSIVVLAMEVYPEILGLIKPGRKMGAASLYDLLDSNTAFIYSRLTEAAYDVAKVSRRNGFKALPLPAARQFYAINKYACSLFQNASGGCAECM